MADNSVQGGADTIRDLARQAGTVKTQVFQIDAGGATGNAEVLITAGQQTMAASLPVVLASNQPAISVVDPDTTASGTLAAQGQVVSIPLSGDGTVNVEISGTWAGVIVFEGTVGGAVFNPLNGVASSTSSPAPSTTVNGLYRLSPAAVATLQVRMSAWASGSATVAIRASAGTGAVFVTQLLPTKLTDGSNTALIDAKGHQLVDGLGLQQLIALQVELLRQVTKTNLLLSLLSEKWVDDADVETFTNF